ncbi:hypothetical protein ACI2UK_13860 [Ralstonia nicotianae]|uniref:hypothetical protein n=1 Tax=Ralstonia pseudosolanacearum TaxID=1310165 RepID=UPI00200538C2|nr:hypothetical protein [Ralstonia pseudosolanacearum]MCK4118371.1 hypothetical protein [Ralstonia pseudosolanacearum]
MTLHEFRFVSRLSFLLSVKLQFRLPLYMIDADQTSESPRPEIALTVRWPPSVGCRHDPACRKGCLLHGPWAFGHGQGEIADTLAACMAQTYCGIVATSLIYFGLEAT